MNNIYAKRMPGEKKYKLNKKSSLMAGLVMMLLALSNGTASLAQQEGAVQVTVVPMTTRDSVLVEDLIEKSEASINAGNTGAASESLYRALRISRQFNYREGKARSYQLMARVAILEGSRTEALRYRFSALREYEWLADRNAMAGINRQIGLDYQQVGLHRKAVEYLVTADSLYRAQGKYDPVVVELAANSFLVLGEFDTALKRYIQLVEQYEEKNDRVALVGLYSKLMICYHEMGQYKKASQVLERSLELNEEMKDPAGIIKSLNNIGYNYRYLGNYDKAAEYLGAALKKAGDTLPEAYRTSMLINLGVVSQNEGALAEAVEYLDEAYRLAMSVDLYEEAARAANIAARIYFGTGDHYNAEAFNRLSLQAALLSGSHALLADAYETSSEINTALYDYEAALEDYRNFLSYRDSALYASRRLQQDYLQQEYFAEKYEKEIGLLVTDEQLRESMTRELILDTIKKKQQIELQQKTIELQTSELQNRELERMQLVQEKMLAEERLAAEIRDREILELKIVRQEQEDSLRQKELQVQVAEAENQVLKKDNELQQETIRRVRARIAFLLGMVFLVVVILVIVYIGLRYARKTNRLLTGQRNKIQQQKEAIQSQYEIIEIEREKSDRLLLNILPEETAAELKEKGRATPQHYEMVSVLFTDFKGFTMVAEKLTPEEVVGELDRCFLEFDKIADKYNLEKIKTIGDAYMCAGGLPVANTTNPVDTVSAALEIRDFMEAERERREKRGEQYWQLRIGINTGPVVAGVVGKNKFAYDIWGDAVNVASRMESSGEPGKVNISGTTYELVKDHFSCTYRGKIAAKNKGEVDMYFVEGKKATNHA